MLNEYSSAIGDYIPLKTLGSGATGKVKLGRHIHTGNYVALKIIKKHLLDRKRSLHQKVHREIAVMKLLAGNCDHLDSLNPRTKSNHSVSVRSKLGVLGLLDVYETDTSFVLVLDYCAGGELFDLLIETGHFPEDKVLDYFQQLVYALDFCHNRGICHRDLKPENVLLTTDGRVKLADFGMASLLTPGSFLETSCGSPQYCAPEILLGEFYEGRPADIWSLGVVLFAMTTGGLPFHDENLHRLTTKIQSGAFHMPPEVPEALANVIRSMLVVDPAKRATLKDIKNSKWFNSRLCRTDIYKDDDFRWKELVSSRAKKPVADPDPTILRYLADLGLGDFPTIRRRLGASDSNVERDFYFQLAEFCQDDLVFTEIHNVPVSPTKTATSTSPNAVNTTVSPFATAVSENPLHIPPSLNIAEPEPLAPANDQNTTLAEGTPFAVSVADELPVLVPVEPSWFPDWTLALVTESASGSSVASMLPMDSHPSRSHAMPGVPLR